MSSKAEAPVQDRADGRYELTAAGRAFYASYFGYAGIDLRQIETLEDLDRARRQAFPVFLDYMAQRLDRRRQTLETRALRAVVMGDWDAHVRTVRQLQTRADLQVITDPASGAPAARS
jgi:hypothetical protein